MWTEEIPGQARNDKNKSAMTQFIVISSEAAGGVKKSKNF